ncbi:scarecrow-like protein 22 [Abeliophyllum distichum]|uniref:Scarecrow-like protein 22 n=1 Tax=Abeliophyllum distichum TaxID=126358 RepID=A0ABD1UKY4_9LAMI
MFEKLGIVESQQANIIINGVYGASSKAGGGGGGSTDTFGVVAVLGNNIIICSKWRQDCTNSNIGADCELLHVPPSLQIGNISTATTDTSNTKKCSTDEWESREHVVGDCCRLA